MRDYRKYDVWQKSHALTLHVYKNVIPVFGRNSDKEFAHFLDISLGSCQEVEYCCLLSYDLGYLNKEQYDIINEMLNEVKAKLINLIKSIRKL